jgi:hypothetical protein
MNGRWEDTEKGRRVFGAESGSIFESLEVMCLRNWKSCISRKGRGFISP